MMLIIPSFNITILIAILIAGIVNLSLGFLWYSPYLFQKRWLAAMGQNQEDIQAQPIQYFINLILTFLSAFVLGYILLSASIDFSNGFQLNGLIDGIILSVLVWAGFVVTTNYASVLFEKIPIDAYIIYCAYQFVAFVLMGTLIVILGQLIPSLT